MTGPGIGSAGFCCLMFLSIAWLPGESPPDPAVVHRFLREHLHRPAQVGEVLRDWVGRTGDQSFSSFAQASAALQRGLSLQAEAANSWERGDARAALRVYQRAFQVLLADAADSEAAFCLYYSAEILFELDRLDESLNMVERGLKVAGRRGLRRPYLEALLLQSRGYTLWFMDHLRASVRAFGEAQARWLELAYAEGQVTTWNNLAVLHEELGLPARAEHCYRTALQEQPPDIDRAIRLPLLLNFSQFLAGIGKRSEARVYLSQAEAWKSADPFEFLLVAAQVQPGTRRPALAGARPVSPGQALEQALVLAKTAEGDSARWEHLHRARSLSQSIGRVRLRRRTWVAIARQLEREGRYAEALGLYRDALREQPAHLAPEFVYAYSRAASPLFRGIVRCLAASDRPWDAWEEIQRESLRRRNRAAGLMRARIEMPAVANELDALEADLEISSPEPLSPAGWRTGCTPAGPRFRPQGYTVLEFWPEGRQVLAWVFSPQGRAFRRLPFDGPVTAWLESVLASLNSPSSSLPPAPPRPLLHRGYLQLIAPLEDLIPTRRLLVIGHQELDSLPVELLVDAKGDYLLQKYVLAYLPSLCLPQPVSRSAADPILLQPPDDQLPGQARERNALLGNFPRLRVLSQLSPLPLRAPWIHVSAHFRLRSDHWLNSTFQSEQGPLQLSQFLSQSFSCSLLSLAFCDAGNSVSWHLPYTLGLAELLLTRPVGGLILSRWRLDASSVDIYTDLLRLYQDGWPPDLALAQARRRSLGILRRRARGEAPGDHPFFWAGIAYVGTPGRNRGPGDRAESAGTWELPDFIVPILLLLLAGAGWVLCRRARTRG